MELTTILREKIAAQSVLVNQAIEAGRAMTEDELAKYQALETEIKGYEATIKAAKEQEAREAKYKAPANMPVYAQPKSHDDDKPFRSFGEQMLAIVKAGRPGGEIDPRLLKVQAAATGASEGIPSDGGFLVQTDFATELLKNVYQTGVLAPRCRKMGISANANGLKINGVDESSRADGSRWGGVRGYWAAEADTVTSSKPKFRQINLTLNKLMALYYSTDELLQDAAAMESVLSQAFADEIKFKLDDAIINGDGSGKPLGILNSGALVTQNKETGQAADTILPENIAKMRSRLIASSRANAVWLINQEVEPQLDLMVLSAGTAGVPVYMPAGGLSGLPYDTLYGRPVIPIEHCAAIGDVGDIILADLSQYLLADKGGMNMASSVHVNFVYDETAFRVTYRVDGQPVRDSAITPFKGTNDLSSFVTLQAR